VPTDKPTLGDVMVEKPERRSYRAPRRDEQKRLTRKRILECALIDFSQRGFDASSLRDIAKEAGTSFSAIQKHFGNKTELWRAAIDEMFARQDEELAFSSFMDADRLTSEDLREIVHRYVRYCARHPEHLRITVHESLRDTDRAQWIAERHTKRVHQPFMRLFAQAVADGLLPAVPMPSMLYIMASAAEMMFALGAEVNHVYGVDVRDPAVIEAHANGICSLLLRSAGSS